MDIFSFITTPIQVYIEQDVISTTVRTRNDEKKLSKNLTTDGIRARIPTAFAGRLDYYSYLIIKRRVQRNYLPVART